jgi:hypothetical protein
MHISTSTVLCISYRKLCSLPPAALQACLISTPVLFLLAFIKSAKLLIVCTRALLRVIEIAQYCCYVLLLLVAGIPG